MNKIKKILAVLLSAVMVMTLVACGSETAEQPQRGVVTETTGTDAGTESTSGNTAAADTSVKKPVELVVFSELANYSGEQQGWVAQMLLDKFNVKITIIPETEGVFDTRMEAGNLGDIVVFGSTGGNYQRAVKQGMLLDWNKFNLLDNHGQYIRDNMPLAIKANQLLTSNITEGASDTLYGFGHNVSPSSDSHEEFFYTWDIRWDLYKQLGYPVVKTMDDLVTLFEDMKAICPTDENGNPTYALSIWPDWDGNMVMYVKSMATAFYGYDEMALGVYDPDTGIFHDALEENGPYLTCLKFFNTLYQKGLLDPNSMSQTYDGMSEKLKAGGAFFSIFNYAGSLAYNTDTHMEEGKYMYTMVPEGAVPLCYGMSVFGGNRVWTIGANTEYPELCMDLINYFCTPEGYMNINYGPKGLSWDYDADKNVYLTEFGLACQNDEDIPMEGGYSGSFHDGNIQINNTTWSMDAPNPDSNGESYNWETWRSTLASNIKYDIQKDWISYNGVGTIHDYMENLNYKVAPATTYNEAARSDEFEVVWKQVTNCIVEYSWNAIYAANDNEFNYYVREMIKKANAYGYEDCKAWSIQEAEKRHQLEEETRGK